MQNNKSQFDRQEIEKLKQALNIKENEIKAITELKGKIRDSVKLLAVQLDAEKHKVWTWEKKYKSGSVFRATMNEKDSVLIAEADLKVQTADIEEGRGKKKKFYTEFYTPDQNIKFNGAKTYRVEQKEIKDILASIDSYEMHLAFHMMFSQSIKRYSMLSLREKEEIASKQAQARKNMARAQSIRKKGRFLGKENSFYGKTHSPEMKLKLSSVHKGKKLTDKHIAILVSCHKGKPKRKVKCPHCGIMIANHAKNRCHFDNCKEK